MALSCALNAATAGEGLPVVEYVALAQRQGYRWIELNRSQIVPLAAMGRAAAGELLERAEVCIASFFLPVAWQGDEETFRRDMQRFADLVDVAAAIGATRCCTWLLPNFATPPAETRRWVGERLHRIARLLADHGLHFGLEFIGPAHFRADPGFTFLYRMEDMLAFALELGPNVGVLVDSFHWHCLNGTREALAALPADRLVHAHINDAPDLPRDQQRDDRRLLPGEGVIDLAGFLSGLQATGYDGPVGIEVDGPALQGLSPDEAAARARRAWNGVLQAFEQRPVVDQPILSVQLYSLRAMSDPAARLRLVAESGLLHVETTTRDYDDPRETRRLLDAHGISAPSGHFGIGPLRERFDWVVETAKTLGLELVVIWGLPDEEHWPDAAGWARAGAELGRIADRLQRTGLAFAFHNHDWELERFADGRLALDVLFDAAAGSALRFQPDVAWIARGGHDPIPILSRHAGKVVACHVKDLAAPGGNPDEEGWSDLGHGVLAWDKLWPAARAAGARLMVLEHDSPADPRRFLMRSVIAAKALAGG